MGKIQASMVDVSTEFKLIEPGVYNFEIVKFEDVIQENQICAYKAFSKVISPGEMEGRQLMDYIYLRKPGEELKSDNIGLSNVKRYFEATHGKDTVANWTDDDYDTDLLIGKTWAGQIDISSYTKKGETTVRQTNEIKRMEPVD